MSRSFYHLVFTTILTFAFFSANAADKITVRIGHQTVSAWRTVDLESAKKEAAAEHKPIAWIASGLQDLAGTKISGNG